MYKRNVFTTITPLPAYISRETVVETLHSHSEMIELNPLVIHHAPCPPASFAPADEFHCTWYELTDRISYLPGGLVQGNVTYKACFYDLLRGLQTHVYAPTGLDIREKWSVCGNMPGEERELVELGIPNAPREGLYLREDVDMRCQIWASSFVKKTLKKAHNVLVDRLVMKADIQNQRMSISGPPRKTSLSESEYTQISKRISGAPSAELPASLQVRSPSEKQTGANFVAEGTSRIPSGSQQSASARHYRHSAYELE